MKRTRMSSSKFHLTKNETMQTTRRKINKPFMEKKRRERMNHSLNELKKFILETHSEEGTVCSRLEKADILELTVEYIKTGKCKGLTSSGNKSTMDAYKYYDERYIECATELRRTLEETCRLAEPQTMAARKRCLNMLHRINAPNHPNERLDGINCCYRATQLSGWAMAQLGSSYIPAINCSNAESVCNRTIPYDNIHDFVSKGDNRSVFKPESHHNNIDGKHWIHPSEALSRRSSRYKSETVSRCDFMRTSLSYFKTGSTRSLQEELGQREAAPCFPSSAHHKIWRPW